MSEIPVIEVKNVFKSFKTINAVRGIDLSIFKGQFVALLGPNGAGKTTLIEMIEGIEKVDSGEILIMGKKWKGNEDELHSILGLSLQETHFINKLTVWETLLLFGSFYKLGKQRAEEIITLIGLEEKRKAYVNNLSRGQKQRLALGISLINYPKILLLDEPTTGLDPNARREIWEILLKLKSESDTSLILTTHYMEEAERLCDQIVVIDQGKILKQGTLKQLLYEDSNEKLMEFILENLERANAVFKQSHSLTIHWNKYKEKGSVAISDFDLQLPVFMELLKTNQLKLRNIECRRKTLDDLFTELSGRHLNE